MYNLFILFFLFTNVTFPAPSLEVEFYNIQQATGTLEIAIFDAAEKFDARSPTVFKTVVTINSKDDVKVQIPDLMPGKTYAVAAFHDVNNNGELDTNMFGIPTEPYAFSNNPKVKWKAPTFAEAAFKAAEQNSMRLRLATWSEQ